MVILGAGNSDEDAADTKVGESDPERVSIVQTAVAETGANACEAPRSLAAHTCNHHEIAVAVAGANACEAPSVLAADNAEALELWKNDSHSFQIYQYDSRKMLKDIDGNLRLPSLLERERLTGFDKNYSSAALPASLQEKG